MKIHPIQYAYDKLEPGIKNTAKYYIEGRNILIYCLSKNAKRTEQEVIEWANNNLIEIKDIDTYITRDDKDRDK